MQTSDILSRMIIGPREKEPTLVATDGTSVPLNACERLINEGKIQFTLMFKDADPAIEKMRVELNKEYLVHHVQVNDQLQAALSIIDEDGLSERLTVDFAKPMQSAFLTMEDIDRLVVMAHEYLQEEATRKQASTAKTLIERLNSCLEEGPEIETGHVVQYKEGLDPTNLPADWPMVVVFKYIPPPHYQEILRSSRPFEVARCCVVAFLDSDGDLVFSAASKLRLKIVGRVDEETLTRLLARAADGTFAG